MHRVAAVQECQKEKRVSKDLIHDFFGSPLT